MMWHNYIDLLNKLKKYRYLFNKLIIEKKEKINITRAQIAVGDGNNIHDQFKITKIFYFKVTEHDHVNRTRQ